MNINFYKLKDLKPGDICVLLSDTRHRYKVLTPFRGCYIQLLDLFTNRVVMGYKNAKAFLFD